MVRNKYAQAKTNNRHKSYKNEKYGYCQIAGCGKQVPVEELRHIDDPRGMLDKGIMVCESCYLKHKPVVMAENVFFNKKGELKKA